MNIKDFPIGFPNPRDGMLTDPGEFDVEHGVAPYFFGSDVCRLDHFLTPSYRYWSEKLRHPPIFHRKQWEWVYICAALHERGFPQPGMRGLGFGVGKEPLVAVFASLGANIVATDQAPETAVDGGWIETQQHSASLGGLNELGICPPDEFARRVSFRHVDMNAIDRDLVDFDFCYSACCFEHLGSIEHGLAFVRNSMKTLRKGGISIHTTEYNLSSDILTYESPGISLFRKSDLKRLAQELRAEGHQVAPLSFYPGAHPLDGYIDFPPYRQDPHFRLESFGYAATSFGILVQKGG